MAKKNLIKSPQNAQTLNILRGVQKAYDNADLIGGERSAITGLHQLMLTNVDEASRRLKSASTDLLETMLGISILEFCDFNTVMGVYMNRLMQININERRITLNTIGNDAYYKGISDNITPYALKPSYADGMNYLDFISGVRADEVIGYQATQRNIHGTQTTISPKDFDYGDLYPDDLDQGDNRYFNTRRWVVNRNQNSILHKTKRMFEQRKINTLISRFGTKADGSSNDILYNGSKRSEFGESHGRNLLKASAERTNGNAKYLLNGYNNPYCRVWTHHYQYNQMYKTIRPFSKVIYDESTGKELVDETDNTFKKIHTWQQFGYSRNREDGEDYGYGWRSKENDPGWEKSVLDLTKGGDGILKIAPKYINSRATNIHTKDCMFSIENLAWRGYDPYSFEKALSWEQRGPLGGRIMWFPPYGITFNETTNVNWSSNSFIGRGEDVYTYVNTVRSGTLSFLLVVDHPSIIDYATWYDDSSKNPDDEYRDTDLLRFFAGCDSLDPEDKRSIMSRVKPTPLTDEYLAEYVPGDAITLDINEPPPRPIPPEVPKATKKVSFYVFYPNNYSGYYDKDPDFAVAYLLAGAGCQKDGAGDMKVMEGTDGVKHDFTFSNLNMDFFDYQHNPGYETTGSPVSDIMEGSTSTPEQMMKALDDKKNFIYGFAKSYNDIPKTEKKRWYYRVDGEYKNAPREDTRNTYGQLIPDLANDFTVTPKNTNYCDTQSFELNSSMSNWPDSFRADEDEDNLYCTFTDIAEVVAYVRNYSKVAEFCADRTHDGDSEEPLAEKIKEIFDNYHVVSVESTGYSNSHAFYTEYDKKGRKKKQKANKINSERNNNLAVARGDTILKWLRHNQIIDNETPTKPDALPSTGVSEEDRLNHSGLTAKLWRSAKITLTFAIDETKDLSETSQPSDDKYVWEHDGQTSVITPEQYNALSDEEKAKYSRQGTTETYQKYTHYTPVEVDGKTCYKDENGVIWVEESVNDGQGKLVRLDAKQLIGVSADMRGASQSNTQSYEDYRYRYNRLTSKEKLYNGRKRNVSEGETNVYRYDQEYYFFRALKKKDPIVFDKLMDKIKYFDPAFHSMTPEGFNARLTFLNQCTRQGNTVTMSDQLGKTANNLAFGRPPFCVLRIGDFYNQMIVIDNINIDYNVSNGIQWDMNSEGIGMQPLLAQVNISFKFIGGGDIAGPVRRLQNAMTFNYYANARYYDNRADRVLYESDGNYMEIGGANHHGIVTDTKLERETGAFDYSTQRPYAYLTNTYKGK